ncbi:hypothetical protein HDU97_000247 [Phlyctochytrium planicorne]|nr:hypothetical protein HDU97_000247 [Phlyctochytrium planicorne]
MGGGSSKAKERAKVQPEPKQPSKPKLLDLNPPEQEYLTARKPSVSRKQSIRNSKADLELRKSNRSLGRSKSVNESHESSFTDEETETPLRQFLEKCGLQKVRRAFLDLGLPVFKYLKRFRAEGLEASPEDLNTLLELDETDLNSLLHDLNMKLVHKAVFTSKLKELRHGNGSTRSPSRRKNSQSSIISGIPIVSVPPVPPVALVEPTGAEDTLASQRLSGASQQLIKSSVNVARDSALLETRPPENFSRRGSSYSVKDRTNILIGASDPVKKLYVAKWSCRQQKVAHDFFISYRAEADAVSAEKLALLLETKSKHCFFDKRCLVDGMDWDQGFLNGLERSKYIILFCSEAALEKVKVAHYVEDNMLLEWERALILRDKNQVFVQPLLVAAYQEVQVGSKISKALLPFKAFDLSEFPDEMMFHHLSTRTRTIREILAEIFKIQGIRLLPDEVEGAIPKLLDGLSRIQSPATNPTEPKVELVEIALNAREAKQLRDWLRPLNMDDERSRQRRRHVVGTRQWLLKQVLGWAQDHAEGTTRVLWLKGASGLGKSVMAGYIADSLQSEHLLGASFFCKHDDNERSDPKRVVETLAYNLSKWSPKFGRMLLKIREEEPELLQRGAGTTRFTKLLLNPLVSLNGMGMLKPAVLVVDALDEVGIKGQRSDFLKIFAQDCLRLPPCIKLFVTSRPDSDIVECFRHMSPIGIEPSQEDNLLDLTIVAEKRLCDEIHLAPEEAKIVAEQLATISEGVFIWLNLAFYTLKERLPANVVEDGLVSLERLNPILSELPKGLDEMYKQTLSLVYLSGPGGKPNTELMRILGAVVCLREPVSEAALSELIGMDLAILSPALKAAQAVVNVSVRDAKVRVIHKSLKDHLTNPTKSNRRFRVRITEEHHRLGESCVSLMLKGLKRHSVPVSEALSYASRYWGVHIAGCLGTAPSLLRLVDKMCADKLPEWLEVLSYLKAFDKYAVPSLRSLLTWYPHGGVMAAKPVSKYTPVDRSSPKQTRALLTDLLRLVLEFRAPIIDSPEDIYRSALPFCPSKSALWHAYSQKYSDTPHVFRGRDAQWGPCLFTLGGQGRDDNAPVLCVSISEDGSRFLSGSADGSLRLWSLETGESLKTLEWDAGETPIPKARIEATAIAVGEGNSTIGLTTSDEGNLVLWSFELGAPLKQITLDLSGMDLQDANSKSVDWVEDWRDNSNVYQSLTGLSKGDLKEKNWACITAITFSKESRVIYIAGDEKIAAVSLDSGSILWMKHEPRCQIILVKAVLHDTRLIIGAGSAIRIVDSQTGAPISSMEITGHLITALASTEDGTVIAYGSDDSLIRLINTDDGSLICTLSGHHGPITSLDISPDGRKIVSASSDATVKIWISSPPSSKSSEVREPARNSDGSSGTQNIGSNEAINHSRNRQISISLDPSSALTEPASSSPIAADFSTRMEGADLSRRPSQHIPFSFAEIGANAGSHITLEGHTQGVTCVSITPDGHRVISGSIDGAIKIWSLDTLGMAERSTDSHTDIVLCVAVSKRLPGMMGPTNDPTPLGVTRSSTQPATVPEVSPYKDGAGTIYHRGSLDFSSQTSLTRTNAAVSKDPSPVAETPTVTETLDNTSRNSSPPPEPRNRRPSTAPAPGETPKLRASPANLKRFSTSSREASKEIHPEPIPEKGRATSIIRAGDTGLPIRALDMVASGSRDRTVKLWNMISGELVWTLKGHMAPIYSVAIRPDGRVVASGSSDGAIKLWSVHSGALIRDFYHRGIMGGGVEEVGRVRKLEFTWDGMRLLSWVEDDVVLVWHIPNGILENRIDGTVRMAPDHRCIYVVDGSGGGQERVLDTTTFMEVSNSPQGLERGITKRDPTQLQKDQTNLSSIAKQVKIVNGWVVDSDGKRVLWLPEEFRGTCVCDPSGKNIIVFGYKGRECFIRL